MTEPIRVLIVDDEPLARERLRRLLAHEADLLVVAEAGDGDAAVAAVRRHLPELLFLDVQMPAKDGFSVVEALTNEGFEPMPVVVFVTAYDEHALRAFEAQALDYLVKPFDDDRFAALLDRVRRRVRQERMSAAGDRLRQLLDEGTDDAPMAAMASVDTDGPLERLVLRVANRSRIVKAAEVEWIGADGVYSRVHVAQTSYLLRMPLHAMESRLDPRRFVRIHRSAIVNLDYVREVHEIERGEFAIILVNGTRLKLSRSRRAQFEAMLGQSL